MRKLRLIFVLIVVVVLSIGYFVGWHTSLGRFVRGISSVALVNRTDRQLEYVRFYLVDASGQETSRYFEHLQPQRSVVVRVRTSDLIVRRIVCEQGQKTFTYEEGANVTPGEVLLVALDSQGKMSSEYGR
jgi:hypothetical protein